MYVLSARRGTTLLELMAVILILMMITAMTIPVVAPAVSGRRIREGARMVSTFLNAARNRSIETGRPAGVWLERTVGLSEVCETLYMAEIPPLYGGDFLDSTVECVIVGSNGKTNYHSIDNNLQDYWNLVIPRSRTTFLADAWSEPNADNQQLVRAGDLIQLEGYDRKFPLKIIENLPLDTDNPALSGVNRWWYILRGRNSRNVLGDYDNSKPAKFVIDVYRNDVHQDGRYVIRWFDGPTAVSWHTQIRTTTPPDKPGNFDRPGVRYKILRQPQRLQAGAMRLPESVVIDLNYSSMTNGNRDSGIPFHPKNGEGALKPYYGEPLFPDDDTPVVIVFSAGGHVERVYRLDSDPYKNWSWHGVDGYGPIYLLVGDREHITSGVYRATAQTAEQNRLIQLEKNWLNLDALWVRITPNTGGITTSLVDNVAEDKMSDPANVNLARSGKAMVGRLVGGR